MKNSKIFLLLILIVIAILLIIITFFKNEIFTFIWVKEYENKYKDINLIEKSLSFDKTQNLIEDNNITINDFNIVLSDLNYNQNDKKLNFNLNFKNTNALNDVGYILRVYNENYCLGDRFSGQISLDNAIEYIISYNKFYEKNFDYKSKSINFTNSNIIENNLTNECKMLKQDESLEDGSLIHKISFELPEEFIINDKLNIELFDLTYQNIGDKTIYQAQNPLTQIEYSVNINEN